MKSQGILALVALSASARADLIINEIMQNPAAVGDAFGEYFEIANTGATGIDLDGYTVSDDDNDSFTIAGSLIVPAGGHVTLGREADSALNGGIVLDYVFSGMNLSNRSDELVLSDSADIELDRVEWDDGATFPDPEGASMSLLNRGVDNNDGSNWHESQVDAYGDGDFGTPGAVNEDYVRVAISGAPSQVDPGDQADMDIMLENPTDRALLYDAWLQADGDIGTRILLSQQGLNMPSGFEITANLSLPVPLFTPEGIYTVSANVGAQPTTALWSDEVSVAVGTEETGPYPGYTLLPDGTYGSKLIDMDGATVHTWTGANRIASTAYLFSDGSILRPCQASSPQFSGGALGGRLQYIAWDGSILWDYEWSTYDYCQHHDVEPMPNGHILVISWERKTQSEAQAAGRTRSGEFWPLLIAELEPVGTNSANVIWEWHAFDHLVQDQYPSRDNYGVVADHPELLNINYIGNGRGGEDWIHANAIDYNAELDQIVFSSHFLDELYVIDHSTTTAQAAGHTGGNASMGGDILYRWGNPAAYERGDGNDQNLYVVHGANWIDEGLSGAGNILHFNNGNGRPSGSYSVAQEIVPPLDGYGYTLEANEAFGPAVPSWTYSDPGTFYAEHLSGAYRMPNGNTLITEGTTGYIFEVTSAGEVVWDHQYSGALARADRYPLDYLDFDPTE